MMRPLSLKSVLALAFAGLALLLSAILTLVLEQAATRQVSEDIGHGLYEQAYQISNKLDIGMQERYSDIHILAAMQQVRLPTTPPSVNRALLESLQTSFPDYAWIGFADTQGQVRYATGGLLQGMSVRSRPWFQQGLHGSYVGDVHDAKLLASKLPPERNGEPLRLVDVAVPVFDARQQLLGVLGAHLAWRWSRTVAESTLLPARRNGDIEAFVLNKQGKVLLAPAGKQNMLVPSLDALLGRGWGRMTWADGDYLTGVMSTRGYQSYPGLGWRVVLRQPVTQAFAPVSALQRYLLLAGGLGALLFAGLGALLSSRLSLPLQQLASAADVLRTDEQQLQLPASQSYLEARQLRDSLQLLLDRLGNERGKLANLNRTLEEKVADRTTQLQQANLQLSDSLAERQQMVEMLDRLAHRDTLTDLYNRRAFYQQAPAVLQSAAAQQQHGMLLLLDVDHFKTINDRYGHDIGDAALQLLAATSRRVVPEHALLARFGGEEFVVLLAVASEVDGLAEAELLRAAIAAAPLATPAGVTSLTVSIGACRCDSMEQLSYSLSRADAALYQAKQGGRNQVRRAAHELT